MSIENNNNSVINQELIKVLPTSYHIINQKEEATLHTEKIKQDLSKNQQESINLIQYFLSSKVLKNAFFTEIPSHNTNIFNKDAFINFLTINSYQKFNDSYTNYKNKIALGIKSSNHLTQNTLYFNQNSNIVLDFPFKDCILLGSQTKDDPKTKSNEEVFFHQVLHNSQINKLLSPKAFQNATLHQAPKQHQEQNNSLSINARGGGITFTRNKKGDITNNLLIKGNNLIALHTLKTQFAGKVKLIYIDPPYNTGNDSFKYNDKFNHSTWLTFMKNRLEIAKELLRDDGVIFVQIDDKEQAYLKVLMDEIFGRDNFVNTISLKSKVSAGASGGGEDIKIKKNIEYIHIFSASCMFNGFIDMYKTTELEKYILQMKNDKKSFKYTQVFYNEGIKSYYKTIKDGKDEDIIIYKHEEVKIKSVSEISKLENITEMDVYNKYFNKIMTTTNAQTSIRYKVWECTGSDNTFYSAEYVPASGRNKSVLTTLYFMGKKKVLLIWFKDTAYIGDNGKIYKKEKYGTFWDGIDYNNVNKDGSVDFTNGKKPELLLERIIEMATKEGDLVLDFFAGSGTTLAVAHKMNRQYIGIEQMDYIEDITKLRLQKVIAGEQGGISKVVNWQGGGSFLYLELAKYNYNYIDLINNTSTTQELLNLFNTTIATQSLLNYDFDFSMFTTTEKDFLNLELEDAKKFLINSLNPNMLYIPNFLKDDTTYQLTKEDIKTTKSFYKEKID